jgi:hypothetical protein
MLRDGQIFRESSGNSGPFGTSRRPSSKMNGWWAYLLLLCVASYVNAFSTGHPLEVGVAEADEAAEEESAAEEEDSAEDYRLGGALTLYSYTHILKLGLL